MLPQIFETQPAPHQQPETCIIAPEVPRVYHYSGAVLFVSTLNVASRAPGGYQHPGARIIVCVVCVVCAVCGVVVVVVLLLLRHHPPTPPTSAC